MCSARAKWGFLLLNNLFFLSWKFLEGYVVALGLLPDVPGKYFSFAGSHVKIGLFVVPQRVAVVAKFYLLLKLGL